MAQEEGEMIVMEVTCRICGGVTKIPKAHKDYKRLARKPDTPYVCEKCGAWVQFQMQRSQGFRNAR